MSIFEYDEEKHRRTLIEEGREEGMIRGKAVSLMTILQTYGNVPDKLKEQILSQQDVEVLDEWLKIAAKVKSVEEFQNHM